MRTVNSMFHKHETPLPRIGNLSKTIPGISVNIQELITTGKITEVSQLQSKKMIYGTKIKVEDITHIDHFSKVINRMNNLLKRVRETPPETPPETIPETVTQ